MQIRTFPSVLLGLLLGALLSTSASATSLEQLDLEGLTAEADLVVIGQIASSQGHFIDGEFFTILEVQVSQTVFGQAESVLQVRVPGGSASINGVKVGETIAGLSPIASESDVALFLSVESGSQMHQIVGFSQGQLAVVEQDGLQTVYVSGQNLPLPIDDFVRQVSEYAAGRN